MRNQLIMGKVNMSYPDEVAFVNDRNTIELQYIGAGTDTVGAAFTLTNEQGTAVNIAYNSEQQHLLFNLFSVLKKLIGDDTYNVVTVTGSIVCGETATNIHPFVIKTVDGRTLHSRPHNSERIIYFYNNDELLGVPFLSLYGGTVNGFTVQSGVNKFNLSNNGRIPDTFQVEQVDGEYTRKITFLRAAIGGDSEYCIEGGGVLKFRYFNVDGCLRYLQGIITNRKRSVGYTDFRADNLVRHTPNGMITQTTDEVTVGFPSVARETYAEDILFSPIIEYMDVNGDWQPCIIASKSLSLNDWDSNDLEITFKVLA